MLEHLTTRIGRRAEGTAACSIQDLVVLLAVLPPSSLPACSSQVSRLQTRRFDDHSTALMKPAKLQPHATEAFRFRI
jgi:hypothetical protein